MWDCGLCVNCLAATGSNDFKWSKSKKERWQTWNCSGFEQTNTTRTHKPTNRRTKRRTDGRRDGRTEWLRGKSNHRGRRKTFRKNMERKRGDGGEMAQRNHAWFTFNLSKGHSLPSGARARVRPLWAEQGVLIVLLVGVVGVVLGHGNWDGGGEELAPLPRILEAAERARLLLIPYIYKQDRHKEKNCREIWTHGLKEEEEDKENKNKKKKKRMRNKKSPKNVHLCSNDMVKIWSTQRWTKV